MEQFNFKIENFEGPLDLLLHLVARHKMEIYEIPISLLIDQYLEVMGALGPDALEPTSEFIEMAARLVYIKSLALLPRQDEKEEQERELVGQLVEYHLCKQAAGKLRDMAQGVVLFVRGPMRVELPGDYDCVHEPILLLEAYTGMMGRSSRASAPTQTDFDELVSAPIVSVSSRVIRILRALRRGSAERLGDLFAGVTTKSEAVATFLGVLELIKTGRMKIDDNGNISMGAKVKENS